MNKSIGGIILQISVALYLFANGIFGISKHGLFEKGGEFEKMIRTIVGKGDFSNVLIIVLSVCAIVAGIFLLLELFRIEVPVSDIILLVFIVIWAIFIIILDIVNPLQSDRKPNFLTYLAVLSSHLMVLGALLSASKRFNR
jgi:hypothetical protein